MTTPAVNLEAIPATLRARPQWGLWRVERDTKIPYAATRGGRAKSNDPATWTDYAAAQSAYQPRRDAGLAFFFSDDDGLTGVDLDKCRDPATGAISDAARALLDELDSYAEVSPSGTGVKVWVKGAVARSFKATNPLPGIARIEVYDRLRFFAVTGWRLDEYPAEPQERQGALDALAARYDTHTPPPPAQVGAQPADRAPEWARKKLASAVQMVALSRDGEKHDVLLKAAKLAGGVAELSDLEIENALMGALGGRAEDERGARQTIKDGIAYGRSTPLHPPATPPALLWRDGCAYCPDCGEAAAPSKYHDGLYCRNHQPAHNWRGAEAQPSRRAGEQSGTEYRPAFPQPESAAQIHDDKPPRPRVFIDSIFQAGLALVVGSPGVGKTPLLAQLAVAFATGGNWLGTMPCPKVKTLYIGVEYDRAYVNDVLTESCGGRPPAELDILTVETFTPPATEDEAHEMLRFYFEVCGYEVIIIDTLSGFLPAEKFKQDRYRGDYREFLAYHRMALSGQRLLVGAWHDTKTVVSIDKAFNGSQGLWGASGGGRVNLYRDEQEDVRLRAQLRGKPRKEWAIAEAWIGRAHIWATVDSEPEPIFGSEVQRAIYRIIKTQATREEPLTPKAIHAIYLNEQPDSTVKDGYIRKMCAVLKGRGLIIDLGGRGYVVQRGASGTGGYARNSGYGVVHVVRNGTELFGSEQLRTNDGTEEGAEWYGDAPHQDASNSLPYHSVPSDPQYVTDPSEPPPDPLAPIPEGMRTSLRLYLRGGDVAKARELCERYGADFEAVAAHLRGAG